MQFLILAKSLQSPHKEKFFSWMIDLRVFFEAFLVPPIFCQNPIL